MNFVSGIRHPGMESYVRPSFRMPEHAFASGRPGLVRGIEPRPYRAVELSRVGGLRFEVRGLPVCRFHLPKGLVPIQNRPA